MKCKSFFVFFCLSWEFIWPGIPFLNNWHYKPLCDELQMQAERIDRGEPKLYDLDIEVPPRTAKSTLVTIAFPAWVWSRFPTQKFITCSYSEKLATGHLVASRRLIRSKWYQSMFYHIFGLAGDQNAKTRVDNDMGGYRIPVSTGGGLGTGEGGNWNIFDDSISAQKALSAESRKTLHEHYDGTMITRLNNSKVDMRVIVNHRTHEEDLSGHVVEKDPKAWKRYVLPAEESDNIEPAHLRKFYVNGLLFEAKLDRVELAKFKTGMGSYLYAGQFAQRPAPEGGGILKRIWWNYWKPRDMALPNVQTRLPDGTVHTHTLINLPEKFDDLIASWDLTFKNTRGTDRVCGGVWGNVETDKFLMDLVLGNMDFIETIKAILALNDLHPDCSAILVEDKANGPAVMSELDRVLPNLVPINPQGSKTSRVVDASKAMSVVAQAEAGHIYLPHPQIAPWVEDFIEECSVFPNGKHDDQVDMTSQAINRMSEMSGSLLYSASQFEAEEAAKRKAEKNG